MKLSYDSWQDWFLVLAIIGWYPMLLVEMYGMALAFGVCTTGRRMLRLLREGASLRRVLGIKPDWFAPYRSNVPVKVQTQRESNRQRRAEIARGSDPDGGY